MNTSNAPINIQPSQDDTEESRKARYWAQYANNPMLQRALNAGKIVEDSQVPSPTSQVPPILPGSPVVPVVYDGSTWSIGDFSCSSSSLERLDAVQSFDFSRSSGMSLQSIAQSVLVRNSFFEDDKKSKSGLDFSDEYQRTCTVSLRFLKGDIFYVAFAELDMSDASRNFLVQGLSYHSRTPFEEFFLPLNDSLVARLLKSAERSDRIIPVLDNNPLSLSLNGEYSTHPYSIAVFGSQDVARINSEYLLQREKNKGYFYDHTKKDLERLLKGKKDSALVRLVGLGGVVFIDINDVDVNFNFNDSGRARACTNVGKKNSL